MPKASQVLAALLRDGWEVVRSSGSSHKILRKGSLHVTWTYHHGSDLGNVQLAHIAKECGYTLDELRKLSSVTTGGRPEGTGCFSGQPRRSKQ